MSIRFEKFRDKKKKIEQVWEKRDDGNSKEKDDAKDEKGETCWIGLDPAENRSQNFQNSEIDDDVKTALRKQKLSVNVNKKEDEATKKQKHVKYNDQEERKLIEQSDLDIN